MTSPLSGGAVDILLVEDNRGDVLLTEKALQDAKVRNNLYVARNGVDALRIHHKEGEHAGAPRPDRNQLDLNHPMKDGREGLAEIKGDPGLKRIPVVILTTSRAEEDILKAYDLNANCYVTKPVNFEQFMHVVRSIECFWLSIVKLPPQ